MSNHATPEATNSIGQPLFDFSNMPVPLEQQIADTLVRIEALLITKKVVPVETVKTSGEDQKAPLAAKAWKRRS